MKIEISRILYLKVERLETGTDLPRRLRVRSRLLAEGISGFEHPLQILQLWFASVCPFVQDGDVLELYPTFEHDTDRLGRERLVEDECGWGSGGRLGSVAHKVNNRFHMVFEDFNEVWIAEKWPPQVSSKG